MNKTILIALALLLLPCARGSAAPLVLDTFVDGDFSFSTNLSGGPSEQQFGSMLGGDRIVSLSTSRRPTTVTASLDSSLGGLSFDTGTGDSGGLREQGYMILTYGGDRLFFPPDPLGVDLSNYGGFEFEIPSLQGIGEISVVLNSRGFGTSYTRIPLLNAGTFHYPFVEIPFWETIGGNISNVESLHFWFIGLSPDFAFSLDEIRVVPEPTTDVLCGMALALFVLAFPREEKRNLFSLQFLPRSQSLWNRAIMRYLQR